MSEVKEPLWYRLMWFVPPFALAYLIARYHFGWTPRFMKEEEMLFKCQQ